MGSTYTEFSQSSFTQRSKDWLMTVFEMKRQCVPGYGNCVDHNMLSEFVHVLTVFEQVWEWEMAEKYAGDWPWIKLYVCSSSRCCGWFCSFANHLIASPHKCVATFTRCWIYGLLAFWDSHCKQAVLTGCPCLTFCASLFILKTTSS